jgi:segregation and condensation protein A
MTAFQLSLPGFEGPVEALQPMVSARQLPLEELPLASIPAQFLAQTGSSTHFDLDLAGEVMSAVSRLMLMKSMHLLATPHLDEEEEHSVRVPGTELPSLRAAAARLSERQDRHAFASAGRMGLVPRTIEPRPARLLADSWAHIRDREERGVAHAVVPPFVRLEVAVRRIMHRIQAGRRSLLSNVIGSGSRRDAVMYFLAMLELVRTGRARAEQSATFAEIVIERAHTGDRQSSRAG